jgi:hypothetical protein
MLPIRLRPPDGTSGNECGSVSAVPERGAKQLFGGQIAIINRNHVLIRLPPVTRVDGVFGGDTVHVCLVKDWRGGHASLRC